MATATETVAVGPAHRAAWQPTARGWAARAAVLVAIYGGFLLTLASVPPYWADRIAAAGVFAIIGLSLNIVLGYVGQVSLGHQGFVGISAFVSAYYVTEKAGCVAGSCGLSAFVTAIVFACLAGAAAAGLLGLVALRIRGLYLTLITLAYGIMAQNSIFEIPALTGGGAGMPAPRPDGFSGDHAFALLVFAFLAVVIFIDWSLIRSKVGRAILSVKHSEPVAASYGINVTVYKVIAFVISGTFAGAAGGLYAFRRTSVVANDFGLEIALLWVLMVVVGGLGNRTGVVIGSMFFALFPFLVGLIPLHIGDEALEDWLGGVGRPLDTFVLVLGAALALLTITKYPGGIGEQIAPITRWLRGGRFTMHPEGHGKAPRGKHGKAAPATPGRIARRGLEPGFLAHLGLGTARAVPVETPTEAIEGAAAPTPTAAAGIGRYRRAKDPDAPWRRPAEPGPAGNDEAAPATQPLPAVSADDAGVSRPDEAASQDTPPGDDGRVDRPGFLGRLGVGGRGPKAKDS